MAVKLPRLANNQTITDGKFYPTVTFSLWWDRIATTLENALNDILVALELAGIAVDIAESIETDVAEVKQAPVILQSTSAKFPNGRTITQGVGLSIVDAGAGSTMTIGAGAVLAAYAGGDTPSSFTLGIVDSANAAAWLTAIGAPPSTRSISTGTGLVGGGNLTADRTLSLATSGVTAGSYGSATKVPTITLDVYGRATIASENTIPVLGSGTYTPTLTGVANVASSTAFPCQYTRVGNIVTVSGLISVTATLTATSTQIGISLPIASNFAATTDCNGAAGSAGATQVGRLLADVTNDRAQMNFLSVNTGGNGMGFTFQYEVL